MKKTEIRFNPDFAVIPMTICDLDEIIHIEERIFKRAWPKKFFLQELEHKDASNLVAKYPDSKGKVIGYVCFRVAVEEMHIFKIATDPDWQRHGAGNLLLAKSIQIAVEKGAQAAFLEVSVLNKAATKLYQKLGFKILSTRPGYYSSKEDALNMGCEL
jgi:ribosomal-protein-alanine N-acetyltransferase